ncbi:MAG: DUF4839 domain-containing protein [Saccharofermentanales bacterium]
MPKKINSIILTVLIIMFVAGCGGTSISAWPEESIAKNVLPFPDSRRVEVTHDRDTTFMSKVKKFSSEDYNKYIAQCENAGFTIEADRDADRLFEAFNAEGYNLYMHYFSSKKELTITLESPHEFSDLKWPNSEIAQLLIPPDSTLGEIKWEEEYGFVIYVGETSLKKFNQYVDLCVERGFTVDYQRGDDFYYAYNVDGYKLSLKYEGNNVMFIRIDAPKDTNETETTTEEIMSEATVEESTTEETTTKATTIEVVSTTKENITERSITNTTTTEEISKQENVSEIITEENNSDFANIMQLRNTSDPSIQEFANSYEGRSIRFTGTIVVLMNHKNYDTRFDVAMMNADAEGIGQGPMFSFTNVNYYEMNVEGTDSVEVLMTFEITGKIIGYDMEGNYIELDPVSMKLK